MERFSDKHIGILGTVFFHSILVVLFGAVNIDLSRKIPEYIELVISSGLLRIENTDISPKIENPDKTVRNEEQVNRERLSRILNRKTNNPIEIPKKVSNLKEMEIPEVKKKEIDKISSPLRSDDGETKLSELADFDQQIKYKSDDEKSEKRIGEKGELTENLPLSNIGRGNSELRSFSIEWFGNEREKIAGELPDFPKGVNQNGIVKIKFYVKPDGTVGKMIPVLKADIKFEEASLNILKKWRFAKLNSEAPQQEQQGVITFVFKLK